MTTLDDIAFFFCEPTVNMDDHRRADGSLSTLYLLRREAQNTFTELPAIVREDQVLAPDRSRYRRVFASSMVLFAGVDLLGRLSAPAPARRVGAIQQRFTHFAVRYLPAVGDADVLYAARNAIMHSFGLYDSARGHLGVVAA